MDLGEIFRWADESRAQFLVIAIKSGVEAGEKRVAGRDIEYFV